MNETAVFESNLIIFKIYQNFSGGNFSLTLSILPVMYFFFKFSLIYVPFKIISARMRRANQ